MIRALYSAASGMVAQQLNVDTIANNLANANTIGYKTRRAQFQDLMYQTIVQPGASASQQTVVPGGEQTDSLLPTTGYAFVLLLLNLMNRVEHNHARERFNCIVFFVSLVWRASEDTELDRLFHECLLIINYTADKPSSS